jgi:NitT/TauT family transport system permease protein
VPQGPDQVKPYPEKHDWPVTARQAGSRTSVGTPPGAGALTVAVTAPGRALLRRRRLVLYGPIQKRTYWFLAVLSLCLVFAFWAALSYTGAVQNLFLPTPTQVWQAAVTESSTGILWPDIAASVGRIVLGFLISSVVAIPIGMLMGSYKVFEASLEPSIDFMRYTPAVAFIPLTLIWFGTSTTQKLVILFIAIFFQEVLLVMDNVKNVPMQFVDMAYTLGLSPAQILRRVIFRASLPGIVDTLRISMGWGWTYLVVVELVGATNGLGFQINQAQRYLDTPEIILGIIVIGILGLLFDFSFKMIYVKAFPYMSRGKR